MTDMQSDTSISHPYRLIKKSLIFLRGFQCKDMQEMAESQLTFYFSKYF
jgi:hypothetical protein